MNDYGNYIDKLYQKFEVEYSKFYFEHSELKNFDGVDFLGINFTENDLTLKIYYTTEENKQENVPILEPLYQNNMVYTLNMVRDTVNFGKIRYEIGLTNRTNTNMLFIYRWLEELFPKLNLYRKELQEFQRLKCSYSIEYQLASMYFLGLITKLDNQTEVEAVKLHYILRTCQDPNKIGQNYIVNNLETLSMLQHMQIPFMKMIGSFVEKLIQNIKAEIWIAAVDYYKNRSNKYKIYIKEFRNEIYDCLYNLLMYSGFSGLAWNVLAYSKWLDKHQELKTYGLAVCCSSDGIWSFNFYLDKN